ncbi:MAG: tetratricopeptide repeat protein [Phycisphaerae bacterium]
MTQPRGVARSGPKTEKQAKPPASHPCSRGAGGPPAISRLGGLLSAVVIVGACLAAYFNSFQGVFVFDDKTGIVEHDDLINAGQPGRLAHYVLGQARPMVVGGQAEEQGQGMRPLTRATFAANYLLSGSTAWQRRTNTWPYHAVNLAIHVLAALTLFGVVRRTLVTDRLRPTFGPAASWLALLTALVWAVHPLAVGAVTYIVQRAESMMGMFYLLALYCVIRGAGATFGDGRTGGGEDGRTADTRSARLSSRPPILPSFPPHVLRSSHPYVWYILAVVACAMGMASKQVMVTAPLIVLIYDRIFLAGSFANALRERKWLYAGLAATWAMLLGLVLLHPSSPTAGFGVRGVTPLQYAVSQPGVILHYLAAAVCPVGLSFDYGWPIASTAGAIILPGLVIAGLIALTIWALARHPSAGFLGAWFFLVLAPTSSFMPIIDLAFDFRMYLPLAALAALVVIGGYAAINRLLGAPKAAKSISAGAVMPAAAALVAIVVLVLGAATFQRNATFHDEISFWTGVASACPDNDRAAFNLANALARAGRFDEADRRYRQAYDIEQSPDKYFPAVRPAKWETLTNWGRVLIEAGRPQQAIDKYLEALDLKGDLVPARYGLAEAYIRIGKPDLAVPHLHAPLEQYANSPDARLALATALAAAGNFDESIAQCRDAIALRDSPAAHNTLGYALQMTGKAQEAIGEFQRAIYLDPKFLPAHYNLGMVLEGAGRTREAIWELRQAIQLKGDYVDALNNLAWIQATCDKAEFRDGRSAVELARKACQATRFANADVLDTLGAAFAETGNFDDAVKAVTGALSIAQKAGDTGRQALFQQHLELYQAREPLRQAPTTRPG